MNILDYVDIDIGTNNEYRESNGNCLPLVQYPFGNQAYVLQSNNQNGGWFYNPHANYTEGIRITNQPSPWLGDYGHITLLPHNEHYNVDLHTSISNKQQSPANLSLTLNRYHTDVNVVPSKNGMIMDVKNHSNKESKFQIECHDGFAKYRVCDNKIYLTVSTIAKSEYSQNYRKYYVLDFDTLISNSESYINGVQTEQKEGCKLTIELTIADSEYSIRCASSYISYEMCELHIANQLSANSVQVFDNAKKIWNDFLGTVQVAEDIDFKLFYTNLYRSMCFPHFINETDSNGNQVYYNFKTKEINLGYMITDIGFWDVYRTHLPLIERLLPKVYGQIIDSCLNYYQSYGWLPRWLAPYERGIMPSTLVDVTISSAIVNGVITGDKVNVAVEALLKNADTISENNLFGRDKLDSYLKYGYVPFDVGGESVSLSLDNYLCDYSIYKALKYINHQDASRFEVRCQSFEKIFNQRTKFFERVDKQQKFDEKFNPDDWGYDFCESSAWQNNLSVYHNTSRVVELFGSKQNLIERLDYIFNSSPTYTVGRYGFEIHEMTEYARINDLGKFAISNQPSFNLPFWYLILDEGYKFYEIRNRVMAHFTTQSNGYPGDEDNGSLASWYVLMCLGMYPFNPVDGMIEFKPMFKYQINKI